MDQGSRVTGIETIGIDLGDRTSHYVVVDGSGEVVEEGRIRTRAEDLARRFENVPRRRVILEVGTQSSWVARALAEWGHEVVLANPRQVPLIHGSRDKSDPVDAESLARVGRLDPALLHPVVPRSARTMVDRSRLRGRDALVRARTLLVNHVRGSVKVHGERVPACSAPAFARRAREALSPDLRRILEPLLQTIEQLTVSIRTTDGELEQLAQERYPVTTQLREVTGVGVVTALAFVLTIEDPERFTSSRSVGSYLGLRPRRAQSGDRDPQLGITKEGDPYTRRVLVNAAQYILGPFGPDTDLRRFGLRLSERGGKAAKKRAVVAVARKLAVLLHRLWITGEPYEPLREASRRAA